MKTEYPHDLKPEYPRDAGIAEKMPEPLQYEGAELLANAARPRLRAVGFTDDEIDVWARSYVSYEHSGDVDSFIHWVERLEFADGVQ